MKILLINMYYYPNMIGGAEHSVKILAESLFDKGHDVSVYTLDGENSSNTFNPETINGVKVYRGYSKSIYKRRIKKEKYLIDKILNGMHCVKNVKADADIYNLILQIKPDVINTNNLVSISYNCWEIARRQRIKTVHTIRDYWLLDPTTVIGKSNSILVTIYRLYTKRLTDKYSGVITAPSKKTIDIFANHSFFRNSAKYVVPNCVVIQKKNVERIIEDKLSRKNETIKFIYVGYLAENKGIRPMLKAFKQTTLTNIQLAICGDGPLEEIVSEAVVQDKRIQYYGKLSSDELANKYIESDVLIVPSLWDEPFGRIIIEGASYGLPVIGSNRGGIPEIIEQLKNGEIIDPNDEINIKMAIERFSSRDYLRRFMREIKNNIMFYSSDNQSERFITIYEKVLEDNT